MKQVNQVKAIISREAAKAEGLKKFFTGDPCRNDHTGERYTRNGQCVECYKDKNLRSKQRKQGIKTDKQAAILKIISRADAQAQDLKRYYVGEVCEYGHQVERYTRNGECTECRSIMNKKHHSRNPHHGPTKYTAEAYPSAIVPLTPEEQAELANVYRRAHWITQGSSIKHNVEHCLPLSHGGVHHPNNLRVVTAAANRAKGNTADPADPEVFHGALVSFSCMNQVQKQEQGREPLLIVRV